MTNECNGNSMTHLEMIARWIPSPAIGTEIGAGASPLPGLSPAPIYVDCFKAFGHVPNCADYYGHACALPFHDNALDYVVCSHVLEHVANPVAALREWYRVLRPGGIIYMVVPDRRATWEHRRALTPVSHFLDDYRSGTSACDETHIDEFVFQADWSLFSPDTAPEDVPEKQMELARGMKEAVRRGEDINIHFHTFEPSNIRGLIETLKNSPARRFNWELVAFEERFPDEAPNGILAVIRVPKGWYDRAQADAFRIRAGMSRDAVLLENARAFPQWAAATPGLGGVSVGQPQSRSHA